MDYLSGSYRENKPSFRRIHDDELFSKFARNDHDEKISIFLIFEKRKVRSLLLSWNNIFLCADHRSGSAQDHGLPVQEINSLVSLYPHEKKPLLFTPGEGTSEKHSPGRDDSSSAIFSSGKDTPRVRGVARAIERASDDDECGQRCRGRRALKEGGLNCAVCQFAAGVVAGAYTLRHV